MDANEAERVLRAVANPVRVELLRRVDGVSRSPSELARDTDNSMQGVAYHLRQLEDAGLVRSVGRTSAAGTNLSRSNYRSDGWADMVRRALPPEVLRPSGT